MTLFQRMSNKLLKFTYQFKFSNEYQLQHLTRKLLKFHTLLHYAFNSYDNNGLQTGFLEMMRNEILFKKNYCQQDIFSSNSL